MKLSRMTIGLSTAVAVLAMTTGCGGDNHAEPKPSATASATATSAPPTGIASGEPAPMKLEIAPGRIGAAKVGMTKNQAAGTGYFDTDVKVGGDVCPHVEPLQWKKAYQGQVDVLTKKDGSIGSMGVRKGIRTDKGVGIGSTLDEVRAGYEGLSPAAEAGYGQTGVFYSTSEGWIGFLFNEPVDAVKGTSKVTFIEVTKGSKPYLMRDGC